MIIEQISGFPCIGTLGKLNVGDKIKLRGIIQDLPEEEYIGKNLKKKEWGIVWNFFKNIQQQKIENIICLLS